MLEEQRTNGVSVWIEKESIGNKRSHIIAKIAQ